MSSTPYGACLQKPPFEEAYILGETIEEGGRIRFSIKCRYDPDGPAAEPIYEPMPWEIKSATLQPATGAGAAEVPEVQR